MLLRVTRKAQGPALSAEGGHTTALASAAKEQRRNQTAYCLAQVRLQGGYINKVEGEGGGPTKTGGGRGLKGTLAVSRCSVFQEMEPNACA